MSEVEGFIDDSVRKAIQEAMDRARMKAEGGDRNELIEAAGLGLGTLTGVFLYSVGDVIVKRFASDNDFARIGIGAIAMVVGSKKVTRGKGVGEKAVGSALLTGGTLLATKPLVKLIGSALGISQSA